MASRNPGWTNFVITPRTQPKEQVTEEGRRRAAVRRRIDDVEQAIELGKLLDDELYFNDLQEEQ